MGAVQATQAPPSSLQAKLEPLSLEVKEKLAEVEVVLEAGLPVIEVWGGVWSAGEVGGSGGEEGVEGLEGLEGADGLEGVGMGVGGLW